MTIFIVNIIFLNYNKNILADLRNTLSPDIYLFINAMQGLKSPLSNEDIRFFTQLDNLFEYD
uniref:hypothetical protein n=1 Tax=Phascolarctobacterium faecium TaxID=33025 RepID=UPI003AB3CEFA